MRDRIDLHVRTRARSTVITPGDEESSEVIAGRVAAARERAAGRWRRAGLETTLTADVRGTVLRREHPADDVAMALLAAHTARGRISQRRVDRTLRIVWKLVRRKKALPDRDRVTTPCGKHIPPHLAPVFFSCRSRPPVDNHRFRCVVHSDRP
ncbi:hypothetical protein [Corynebacterium meridianum]|uniref:magnesium chelatase subunit ChlI family protein n=1 Tax=Corynebacterium meridianum TaxID=2765363 RepID=UPI001E64987F|nr:hypothetical protein [Corynebacterium meridianum]